MTIHQAKIRFLSAQMFSMTSYFKMFYHLYQLVQILSIRLIIRDTRILHQVSENYEFLKQLQSERAVFLLQMKLNPKADMTSCKPYRNQGHKTRNAL